MRRGARIFLIIVSVLNGLAGLICGVLLVAAPDGSLMQMGVLLPTIQTFPMADVFFQDFMWIGIVMLLGLGIPNSVAAVMLVRQHDRQYYATFIAAVLLMFWCGFEIIYMFNVAVVGYLVVALISLAASILLQRPGLVPGQDVEGARTPSD